MSAPARPHTETRAADSDAKLRRARQFVAESLIGEDADPAPAVPAITPWKAWLMCGWLVVVVACYVVTLLSGRM
jgi:hypothetical protein